MSAEVIQVLRVAKREAEAEVVRLTRALTALGGDTEPHTNGKAPKAKTKARTKRKWTGWTYYARKKLAGKRKEYWANLSTDDKAVLVAKMQAGRWKK